MKVMLLPLALLTGQLAIPVSDSIPQLNVEPLCKATTDLDMSMGLTMAQSFDDCMRDEMTAKRTATGLWATAPASLRDACEGEASAGDSQSYVDLLTCMQMSNLAKAESSAPTLRGASKNRNKNKL
jgi:hypothetical protein